MSDYKEKLVTVIYYSDTSLELLHTVKSFLQCPKGRVVIPDSFKKGKSIIAVCEGQINIMNKVGDRILGADEGA
jgi:uncharacterized protein (TIGR02922 family)